MDASGWSVVQLDLHEEMGPMHGKYGSVDAERCWTEEIWRTGEPSRFNQGREEVHAALQYAACFHCLVEEKKKYEELGPKPK